MGRRYDPETFLSDIGTAFSTLSSQTPFALAPPRQYAARGNAFVKVGEQDFNNALGTFNTARSDIGSILAPGTLREGLHEPTRLIRNPDGGGFITNENYDAHKAEYDRLVGDLGSIQSQYGLVDEQAKGADDALLRQGHTARQVNERDQMKQVIGQLVRERAAGNQQQDEFSGLLNLDEMLRLAGAQ
jgi:hypothetical protein